MSPSTSSSPSWTTTTRSSASRRKPWSSPLTRSKAPNRTNATSTATDLSKPKNQSKLTKPHKIKGWTNKNGRRLRWPNRMSRWKTRGPVLVWRNKIPPKFLRLRFLKLLQSRAFCQTNSSRSKLTTRKAIPARTWSRSVNSGKRPSESEAMATKTGLPCSLSTSKQTDLPKTTKRKSPPSLAFWFFICLNSILNSSEKPNKEDIDSLNAFRLEQNQSSGQNNTFLKPARQSSHTFQPSSTAPKPPKGSVARNEEQSRKNSTIELAPQNSSSKPAQNGFHHYKQHNTGQKNVHF